jgi:hypothetical protein
MSLLQGTAAEIIPVASINGRVIGGGKQGGHQKLRRSSPSMRLTGEGNAMRLSAWGAIFFYAFHQLKTSSISSAADGRW